MIDLLLDALAAYRLTKLVTDDTLLDGPRDAVVRWSYERRDNNIRPSQIETAFGLKPVDFDPGEWAETAREDATAPKLATLITCRWCAGMWVSLGVVAASTVAPRAWRPVARALALSAAAALAARLED